MPTLNASLITGETAGQAGIHPAGRLRVLHLNAGNLYGGVETLLTTLAEQRNLCPGMEPHFAVCYEGRCSQELRVAGVPVDLLGNVRISRPWTVWRARRRLRQLLEKKHFDLVLCHMAWPLVVFGGTARAAGIKVALWEHGFESSTSWLERAARRLRPDLTIANSDFTAGIAHHHFPDAPVRVMFYPLALAEAPAAEKEQWRAALRDQQGVDADTTVILQVSRMEPWKGHVLHLQALSRLKTAEKWVCWITGGPQKAKEEQYFGELRQLASQLGIADRVRFLGQRSDVPKLLAAADVFCQPNQGPEPFGIVFIEALWAGRPVVSTAMGGAQEIVDQTCGLLAQPADPDSLAQALRRLIESRELRQRLGTAGPSRARQLCDPAERMKDLKAMLQDATASR